MLSHLSDQFPLIPPVVAPATQDPDITTSVAGAIIGTLIPILIIFSSALTGVLLCVVCRQRKRPASPEFLRGLGVMSMIEIGDGLEVTMSSGSGGGKPFLQQRTIAKEVGVCDAAKPKGVVCVRAMWLAVRRSSCGRVPADLALPSPLPVD